MQSEYSIACYSLEIMEKPSGSSKNPGSNPDARFEDDLQKALALSLETHAMEKFREKQAQSSTGKVNWLLMCISALFGGARKATWKRCDRSPFLNFYVKMERSENFSFRFSA